MYKRFVVTTVLGFALLFSQGGNFLIAALCPHLQSGTASCETQTAGAPMSHEDMVHVGMEHDAAPAPARGSDTHSNSTAIGKEQGACSHCAVHSGTPRAASLRETETAKRAFDHSVPLQFSRVAPVTEGAVAILSSRAHGPPGKRAARYILIHSFRI